MNLFELFQSASEKYLAKYHGVAPVCPKVAAMLNAEFKVLQTLYFKDFQIDYSSVGRMSAYCMHYAPRYAVVWRSWLQQQEDDCLLTSNRLNSFGTGPGSEIIGIASASRLGRNAVLEAVCFERNEGWRDFIDLVVEIFNKNSDIHLSVTFTNDLRNFQSGAPVVGSCVLCELGRDKMIGDFIRRVSAQVGQVEGRFLDFPVYPCGGKTPYVARQINGCAFDQLRESKWGMGVQLSAEHSAFGGHHIKYVKNQPPGLNMHKFRFP